jgi:hypothetical protein
MTQEMIGKLREYKAYNNNNQKRRPMGKLIKKEGKFYKECGVAMVNSTIEPTTGTLLLRHIWKGNPKLECNSLWLYKDTAKIGDVTVYNTLNGSFADTPSVMRPQHLYITSDDEIKEGDWFMSAFFSYPIHNIKELRERPEGLGWTTEELNKDFKGHKIIATTDTSLKIITGMVGSGTGVLLPQPSDKFIQAYIDAYNKGEKIEKVLVEYEYFTCENGHTMSYETTCVYPMCGKMNYPTLKLKDNNIIIKKVKDSWAREELPIKIIQDMIKYCEKEQIYDKLGSHGDFYYKAKNWIEENL